VALVLVQAQVVLEDLVVTTLLLFKRLLALHLVMVVQEELEMALLPL
jgi:hypothetical protein